MSDLKPCPNPWCESDPVKATVPKHGKMYYEVFCRDCGLTAPCSEDARRAVEIWNTRAAPKVGFEYKKVFDHRNDIDWLNELGAEGWELVSKRTPSFEPVYKEHIFKRRILSALTPETEK